MRFNTIFDNLVVAHFLGHPVHRNQPKLILRSTMT